MRYGTLALSVVVTLACGTQLVHHPQHPAREVAVLLLRGWLRPVQVMCSWWLLGAAATAHLQPAHDSSRQGQHAALCILDHDVANGMRQLQLVLLLLLVRLVAQRQRPRVRRRR